MPIDIARGALLLVFVACASGCPWNRKGADSEETRKIMNCSGGVLLSYNVKAGIETDLRTKIAAGVDANEAVKGHIFELLPPADRLKGYELYLDCMRQPADPSAAHPRLHPLIERTQPLWNTFNEADRMRWSIPFGDADKYAQSGAALKALSTEGFNRRSLIRKDDRQALMYFAAAEIIIRSKESPPALKGKATEYARDAREAALRARAVYEAIVSGGASADEAEWLQSIDVRETILNHLADAQAQLAYLTDDPRYLKELDETLDVLSCDYLRKYETINDPMYRRIPMPRKLRNCSS